MLITSVIGLIANMISAYMLHDSHHLSTKSAYLHVITDLLSSVAVIIGGILMYYTGFLWIDTILSAGISVFIIRSAIRLMKNAGIVLMDTAPEGISVIDIEQTLKSILGIEGVHDIHIWEISPGNISVSAHITTSLSETKPLLESAQSILKNKFNCEHITLQIEDRSFSEHNGCDHCSMHQD
jgi:cobalt-zinc-cadmium efflux system protein